MIISGNYNKVLDIVRQQVMHGAKIIGINMDDVLLDLEVETSKFLNLINTKPDLSALPIMIESYKWSTLFDRYEAYTRLEVSSIPYHLRMEINNS